MADRAVHGGLLRRVAATTTILLGVLAGGGCVLLPSAIDSTDARRRADQMVRALLDVADQHHATSGPAKLRTMWLPCVADEDRRTIVVSGTTPANPAVLADTGKARHLYTLLRRKVADDGVHTVNGLDVQFPGTHKISMTFPDRDHDRFFDVDVPVMDALGNDDGVLTVAVTYKCTTHPPHSQHADEQAARRTVEDTTTLLTATPPAAAVATPCRSNVPERSWTTRHTLPVTGDTASALRASLTPLDPTDGWKIDGRVNTTEHKYWYGKYNGVVTARASGIPGTGVLTLEVSSLCWRQWR